MTDESPAMAPILMKYSSQASDGPRVLMATAMGAGTLSCEYGTMPVSTRDTAM